ncbi:MAG: tetratricopeptide repeat protein [Saprospiraceae bacterium]
MDEYKFILKGRFDFGSKRSFDNVLNMYEWKITNHYKKDVIIEQEELFNEEEMCLVFPRSYVTRGSLKNFNAITGLIQYLSDFAYTGQVETWRINETTREVEDYHFIEPTNDRAAVTQYEKGRKLAKEDDKTDEAMAALDIAIQKYENHATAYERRAFISMKLKKYHDAIRDYSKSIKLYAGNPDPYYGRAIVHKITEDYASAIEDFDTTIKRSIPLQPIHYAARRRKAESLMELENYDAASTELRFFTMRKFDENNSNFQYRKKAYFNYGVCQYELGKYKESVELLNKSLEIEKGKFAPSEEEIMYYRGMARHKGGFPHSKKDLKQAAAAGISNAALFLADVK